MFLTILLLSTFVVVIFCKWDDANVNEQEKFPSSNLITSFALKRILQSQLLGAFRQSSENIPRTYCVNFLPWWQVDPVAELSMKLIRIAISQ